MAYPAVEMCKLTNVSKPKNHRPEEQTAILPTYKPERDLGYMRRLQRVEIYTQFSPACRKASVGVKSFLTMLGTMVEIDTVRGHACLHHQTIIRAW